MNHENRSRAYWRGQRIPTHTHVYSACGHANQRHWSAAQYMSCEICGFTTQRRLAAAAIDAGAIVRMDAAQNVE